MQTIKKMAFQNMNLVKLFKVKKFRERFLPFLDICLETAYQNGGEGKSCEDILKYASEKFIECENQRRDYISLKILVNKWILMAYNEGRKRAGIK